MQWWGLLKTGQATNMLAGLRATKAQRASVKFVKFIGFVWSGQQISPLPAPSL